jgi:hypothetical protein
MAQGGLKFTMDGVGELGNKLKINSKKFTERQIKSVQAAARMAKDEIETEGRANIRAGGNFGSARWQEGFQAKISFQGRANLTIRVTHSVTYWHVFEDGAVIRGNPLLWIPLSDSNAAHLGVRARDYPGPLFRVDRKNGGAPLLHDGTSPQYFGKESVTIPKKWDLRGVVRRVARQMNKFYRQAMRDNG